MKAQWKIQRAAIALLCAVAASGCDSRQPLSPTTRDVARRASVNAPQALGGGFIPAPGNTSPTAVSNPPYVNLLTLPESTWVVLNVTGNVQLTWNEAPCAQRLLEAPNWACQDGSPLVNFDAGPWEGGPVWLRTGEGSGGLVRLRGVGGPNPSAAVGLYYGAQPATLAGHVNLIAQWAPDPNFGNGPFSYLVGGGYSVAATAVPSPLRLTEGEPDSTGERPYTVEALYGLQFINPAGYPVHIPAGATFWRFFPGDSVGDTPERTGGGWDVRECQNQVVCRYRPPMPGRMQVQAYVEGQFADVRSKPAAGQCQNSPLIPGGAQLDGSIDGGSKCAQEPKLSLKCNGQPDSVSVERGSDLDCRAELTPPGISPLRITSWSFNGQGRTDGDTTSRVWAGPMIESGTVRVRGQWGEQQGEASVIIDVVPRVWPDLQITRVVLKKEVEPRSMVDYAPAGTAFGRHFRGELALDSMAHRYAATGPNAGYFYVGAPLRILASTVWVHPALYLHSLPDSVGPSSPGYSDWRRFYDDQNGAGSGTCDNDGLNRFRGNIEHHEGLTLADDSHVGVANGSFRADSLQMRFERQFSLSDSSDVEFRVAVVMDSLTNNTSNYHWLQAHFDSIDTHNVYNVGCSLDYNRSDP